MEETLKSRIPRRHEEDLESESGSLLGTNKPHSETPRISSRSPPTLLSSFFRLSDCTPGRLKRGTALVMTLLFVWSIFHSVSMSRKTPVEKRDTWFWSLVGRPIAYLKTLQETNRSVKNPWRVKNELEFEYTAMCSAKFSSNVYFEIEAAGTWSAILFGEEAWNRDTLLEIDDGVKRVDPKSHTYPKTFISAGKRQEEAERRLKFLGIPEHRYVIYSYPSCEEGFSKKDINVWFQQAVGKMSLEDFRDSFCSTKAKHVTLAQLNTIKILELIAAGHDKQDYVMFLEDDGIPVRNFASKMKSLEEMLKEMEWDVVFHGTCFDQPKVVPDKCRGGVCLVARQESRCLNGVLFKRSAAKRLLQLHQTFSYLIPIDHMLNQVFKDLNLKVYHTYPPLIHEVSKMVDVHGCPSD